MEKETILINRKLASFDRDIEVDGDIIVPDIKPDILSIINTNGNAYIYREELNNGRIRVDGNLDTYTVYLSDSGETRSIQSTLNFSESFESQKINENSTIRSKVYIRNIESKMLNERKLSIKASLRIKVEVYRGEEIDIGSNCDPTEDEIQFLKEDVDVRSLVGSNKVKTSIKEDLQVDSSIQIAEILKVDINITNNENKISYNKVLAKADCNIKILYLTEEGKIGTANGTFPVMSFIELDGVKEGQDCLVNYEIRNMLFKVNSTDSHSISCQIEFEVSLDVCENKTFSIILDAYGTKKEVKYNSKNVLVPVNADSVQEKVSISEKYLIEDLLNIYDLETRVNVLSNTEGELIVRIFYESDNGNGLNVKEFRSPFIMRQITNDPNNLVFTTQNVNYTVNGEYVNFSVDILYTLPTDNYREISLADDFETENLKDEEDYKIYMYFVKEGDTIWKIAKRFRVTMDDIIRLNELENPDKINIGDRLFIMR